VTGARGPSGTNGGNGATGATGPQGPTGSVGSIVTYTNQVDFHVDAGSQAARTADCNPGDQVTGGGFYVGNIPAHAGVSEPSGQGWFVDVEDFEGIGSGVDAAVFARCIHFG
jgi:hypothetical protein